MASSNLRDVCVTDGWVMRSSFDQDRIEWNSRDFDSDQT